MTTKNILLIDDELMLLFSMQRMLEDLYTIEIATSGKDAIGIINNSQVIFDLIICDLNMPNMNGAEFYDEITKNHPELKDKIIFMTGGPMSDVLSKYVDKHASLCLSKPFEFDVLRQTIQATLASH